ncbi:MAG: type II toxin-antitoxin system VapC family toxin [Deltaproteobacteria bacterium]|nr:type II toxin-antitoxin system VapC family toxin [Deltaproteobacteria bacterium]
MSEKKESVVLYWDASAVLSALLKDEYSKDAQKWAKQSGHHFLSHLSYSEVMAVLSRIRREKAMPAPLADAAGDNLENGPWRRLNIVPSWSLIKNLSQKWSLRGADLWHLSAAKSLRDQFPELQLLTYDARLKAAAQGEEMDSGSMAAWAHRQGVIRPQSSYPKPP